ncbi:unnamed protein product [Rotaria magnacalcarata]|uniref:F-box domain-containing protein n=1 Tax=Rotaria magnacalcarata TaxID=392030 RepID=A0A815ZLB8_9BILA|nr:unnamed protein product [Rotaria magnacalcarata]
MSIKKVHDQDLFHNVIGIGLRMYGNGYPYAPQTVSYITEYCRQQIRHYFIQHNQLVRKSHDYCPLSYLSTLVYTSRHKKYFLKRLQHFFQAKDRPVLQQDELVDNIIKDKKLTMADRFKRICRQTQISIDDNQTKAISSMLDRQRSRQYARLDIYYKSDALTSDDYLLFVEQQHSSFNSLRSLSSIDIQYWLQLNNLTVSNKKSVSKHDLRLTEICVFLIKEILLSLMDKVYHSPIRCDIHDIIRRQHVQNNRLLIQCAFDVIALEFIRQLLRYRTYMHPSIRVTSSTNDILSIDLNDIYHITMPLSCSMLEMLPDEIILEVCRYLHSGDVLYSFFDLNSRLNQTITFYRQHVSLHKTFYMQFIEIFTIILPKIESSIRSLVIFELESPLFFESFKTNHIYEHLEKLTLVNWTDEKLILFLDTLHGMKHFHTLVIQALDLTESVKNINLLKKILGANDNRLTIIVFDHECDAFNLIEEKETETIFSNIIKIDIELQTTKDLLKLVQFTPNVKQIHTTFKRPLTKILFAQEVFTHLTELSVYAMSWFSTFDDLKTLVQISSTIENFSFVLVTRDYSMIDGKHVLSIVPSRVKQFNYSICYHLSDKDDDFNASIIIKSWKSIPIAYSISEHDKRIFLHTILYQPNRLSLRSLFNKNMSTDYNSQIYKKVRHLHVYDTNSLSEISGIVRHCRQILDLIVSIRTLPSRNPDTQKTSIALPYLGRLDFLSIQGTPPDSHYIERILLVAPNLSAISIDFDCLFKLLSDDDQSLSLFYLLHRRIVILCIRFEETVIEKLTAEHIHCIARIFFRVNHMCIDLRNSKLRIESQIISLILKYFPKLMVLSLYGQLSEDINSNKDMLCQYLAEQSIGRLTNVNKFKIDYGKERLKVWM